jgi:AsnC-like helix-turn-helix protein
MVRAVSRVSGEDCFVADVVCRRIEDVSALLAEIKLTRAIQGSRTAFVMEQILDKKGLGALEPSLVAEAPAAELRER